METRSVTRAVVAVAAVLVLSTACTPSQRVTDVRNPAPVVAPITTTSGATTSSTVPGPPGEASPPEPVLVWPCPDLTDDECEILVLEPDGWPFIERSPLRPPALHHFRDAEPPTTEIPYHVSDR